MNEATKRDKLFKTAAPALATDPPLSCSGIWHSLSSRQDEVARISTLCKMLNRTQKKQNFSTSIATKSVVRFVL